MTLLSGSFKDLGRMLSMLLCLLLTLASNALVVLSAPPLSSTQPTDETAFLHPRLDQLRKFHAQANLLQLDFFDDGCCGWSAKHRKNGRLCYRLSEQTLTGHFIV